MFAKAVILLLLLIVAISLLSGRGMPAQPPGTPPSGKVRPLALRIAMLLLALGAAMTALHLMT